jgi:hypothetical protein
MLRHSKHQVLACDFFTAVTILELDAIPQNRGTKSISRCLELDGAVHLAG